MSEDLILEMEAVTVAGTVPFVNDLADVSLALGAGELAVIVQDKHADSVSLFDVASGLIAPEQGVVRFRGADWRHMGLFSESAERGRIGRVFETGGWVSNLDMIENIALSQRHHTDRPDQEVREAVLALCEQVGLRDCLADRPHVLSRSEQRLAQWVRAFLGQPELLLLNAPVQDVRPDRHAALLDLVGAARARGAAVVWKSREAPAVEDRPGFENARRYALEGGRLSETGGGKPAAERV